MSKFLYVRGQILGHFNRSNVSLQRIRFNGLHSKVEGDNIKTKLLACALQNVNNYGWTEVALARAASDIGLTPLSHNLVSRGAVEIVEHFLFEKRSHVNKLMSQKESELNNNCIVDTEKHEEILFKAIEAHLEYMIPFRQSWSSALALLMAPHNVTSSLATMQDLTDDLCNYTDIKTTRMDWYTERGLLASLYCSVELFFLTDVSPDLKDTKEFLRRGLKVYSYTRGIQ